MRGPMSLFDQVNAFNRTNRQRLLIDRTVQQRPPVYSSLNRIVDDNRELKTRSFDVYTSKHLATNRNSVLSYCDRTHLDEFLLPSIARDINEDENRRRRKRKRPFYRKSLFHSYSSNSTQADLVQLTARGLKPESHITIPIIPVDDTVDNDEFHHAPPPSPSDNEIERLLHKLQDEDQSRVSSRQSPIEKEGYIPFRLPLLHQSSQYRHTPTPSPPKDIRSTLSNYLQRYY
jgi:hypothetical protein